MKTSWLLGAVWEFLGVSERVCGKVGLLGWDKTLFGENQTEFSIGA